MRRRGWNGRGITRRRPFTTTTSRASIWPRRRARCGEWCSERGDGLMKKRIVLVLVVLVAAGAGVYAFRGRNSQPNNRIVVSGNIELTEVNIGFKTAGRLIERNVDEGDAVK